MIARAPTSGFSVLALLAFVTGATPACSGQSERAIFAGGCYWGVEAVFEHLHGVRSAVSGFATPAADSMEGRPALRRQSYVEAVRVEYDSAQISYGQLLEVFFLVAHDPTQLDRQGPDHGPQYRSIVFVDSPEQKQTVDAYLDQLRSNRAFSSPIVTEIAHLRLFRDAPGGQQDYVMRNPGEPYVRNHDIPKLVELQGRYPGLYR